MSDVPHPDAYERSDADARLIGALVFGIATFLAVTPFLLQTVYPRADGAGQLPHDNSEPPAPRLQTRPKIDLERLRSYERGKLETFGWADRGASAARIPIDRAMQLLSERGLPGWPSAPEDRAAPR